MERLKNIFLLLPAVTLSSNLALRESTCPDQELGDICDAECRLHFVACREGCTDSLCETECLTVYSACVNSCPCFHDCPDGCIDCSHPTCLCKDPQTNPFFKHCQDEATKSLKKCVTDCYIDFVCIDECHDSFTSDLNNCPCMSNCQTGCPCDGSNHCERFFMNICELNGYRGNSIISANGNFVENRFINIPESKNSYPYLHYSGSAALNGEIYIFGGTADYKKISIILACSIVELPQKLLHNYGHDSGSLLTVPGSQEEIMLCFTYGDGNACENFDGANSRDSPYKTQYNHNRGCLALYKNLPMAINGGLLNGDYYPTKVESLGLSGWIRETDHPNGVRQLDCLSIGEGVITVGGERTGVIGIKEAYYFKDNVWSLAGVLKEKAAFSTLFYYENTLLIFGGRISPYANERATWNGTHITSSEVISVNDGQCVRPIIYETTPDNCIESCEEYCFP